MEGSAKFHNQEEIDGRTEGESPKNHRHATLQKNKKRRKHEFCL